MFRGQFKYAVDPKGRISLPAKLRKHISSDANETFIMAQGTVQCIVVYPLDFWNEKEEKLLALNEYEPDQARFLRMTMQNIAEDKLDSQSRLLVPQDLLNYAKIEKDVLIFGFLKRIEFWNPDVYEEYIKQSPIPYEQLAAKVMG